MTYLALGGMLYTTGDPDREPLMLPGHQADYVAGLHAAVATLAALLQAERCGLGQHVDVSIMESVASILEATTVAYDRDGVIRRRQGNRHGRTHPMALLPCKDGYVGVMVASDADWEPFAAFSGLDGLLDSRFADGAGRLAHADEIDRILHPWLMDRTREELFHSAQEWRFPFAMVLSPQEVFADRQHGERGFFSTVHHPAVVDVTVVGAPFQMSETPWLVGRAPTLGEHNEEILGAPGRPEGELAAGLVSRAELAQPPTPPLADRDVRHYGGAASGALAGIRVVDLTTMWAGPYCTRLLGDLGAEVIKIEAPARPDGTRSNPGYFNWLNRDKLCVTLDLNSAQGKDAFCSLVAASDVVVENFSPRGMGNLGLDYAALRTVAPEVMMLSMPAYGSSGPYRNYVAYGPGIEAMSERAWLTGYDNGDPMLAGSAYADPIAGLHGAVAVLAALRHRRRIGRGQRIDLSQRESLSQLLGEVFVAAGASGDVPARTGNRHPTMAPHGCYRCAGEDKWVAIAVEDDAAWLRLCEVMEQPLLGVDPRYATVEARQAHEGEIDPVVEAWTRQRGHLEAMRILQQAGVTAGAVLDGGGLSGDRHLAARGFFVHVPDAEGKVCQYPGVPWRLSREADARTASI